MKIRITHRGLERNCDINKESVLVGRPNTVSPPDVDLTPDVGVSRQHARIWLHAGGHWIEDLRSRTGTFINEARIETATRIAPGDRIRMGETTLLVEVAPDDEGLTVRIDFGDTAPTAKDPSRAPKSGIHFDHMLPGDAPSLISVPGKDASFEARLGMLLDLPLHLSAEADTGKLLQLVVERVMSVIPGAERGALILNEPESGRYRLKAHLPPGMPAISETLAQRAITGGQGFIWHRSQEIDPTHSMRQLHIAAGMYAPMIWQGQTLGVICVDNPKRPGLFGPEDLRFLLAVAHYAAAAVASRRLQENLVLKSGILERLLTSYSPRVRQTLLDKAQAGKLEPGGKKSEVTILFSDFRGFTATCSRMNSAEVMEMLNEYFPPLVDAIFRCDGTVDKFIGDAILAVFGSPEPDAEQCIKAVRAAVAMRETVEQVNERRLAKGKPVCQIGIGLHFGEVVHGFVGAAERLEYTVIGDAVNRASRYCNGAKGGEVLVSEQIFEQVFGQVQAEKTVIPTKHEGDFVAYQIVGLKSK